jgi:hypothetical protein
VSCVPCPAPHLSILDVTIYLVVNDFGSLGRAFVETDIAEADRETVIRDFLSGQYSNALRVVAFNTERASWESWASARRGV